MRRALRQTSAGKRVLPAIAFTLLATIAVECSSSGPSRTASASPASSLAPIHGTYAPKIDPANFVTSIDDPYFPLEPGATFLYRGVHENGTTPQTDEMVVTHQTKVILGVTCVVVRDTVSSRGKPIERTFDWYAQDKYGNVWHLGEDTREVHHGYIVKMSDSWEGGVNGARAGIIMPGKPRPGDQYRQEYFPHHALDQAELGSGGPIQVPSGTHNKTLLTVETSPMIDPSVAEDQYYVAGVDDIKEQTFSGNQGDRARQRETLTRARRPEGALDRESRVRPAVLIRSRQLNGSHGLGFTGDGLPPWAELQLAPTMNSDSDGWRKWPSERGTPSQRRLQPD